MGIASSPGQARLEPFAATHLQGVAAILADPDVQRFTRIAVPVPDGFAATWLQRYELGREEGSREAFAVVDGDERLLGLALVPRIDTEARTAELGYVVSPDARRRGVATGALRLLTDWAFGHLDALRLELLIGTENEASKRVAVRNGYVREGVLRSLYVKPGVWEDTEIWSRLATDPTPV